MIVFSISLFVAPFFFGLWLNSFEAGMFVFSTLLFLATVIEIRGLPIQRMYSTPPMDMDEFVSELESITPDDVDEPSINQEQDNDN